MHRTAPCHAITRASMLACLLELEFAHAAAPIKELPQLLLLLALQADAALVPNQLEERGAMKEQVGNGPAAQ